MGHQIRAVANTSDLVINERRADLDWLRVIAFGLLIYFHAAIAFILGGIPMIQNTDTSLALQLMVSFLHQFRLALLFLISGVGEFTGSFAEFYRMFFTEGVYPAGNLSWHHYWFIVYLYLFCLLGWPIFTYFKRATGQKQLARLSQRLSRGAYLYIAIVPLAVVEIALRAPFPGFRDLIHDWASFSHWFIIFIAGFLLASSRPVLDRTQQLRGPSLALAMLATVMMFAQFWKPEGGGFSPLVDGDTDVGTYVWFCVLRVSNVWFWLLACLGYAGRYLQRPSSLLTYLNGAVYPLFCVHLTVIVALEYVIVPLDWSILAKYLVITTGTLVVALGSYELFWRRIVWMRPFLGLKRLNGKNSEIAPTVISGECYVRQNPIDR